jgi:tetratricopeptide (TPR) repeat protein
MTYRYFTDDEENPEQLSQEKNKRSERIFAYHQLGMRKEAVDECLKLINLDHNDPSSFVELGFNLEEKGEIDKAIGCYQYAIKKFPEYACLYTNLGYCFEKYKKRNDLAVVCYEKALELDPDNEWAMNNIGVSCQRLGRREEALYYYEKACSVAKKAGDIPPHLIHNLAWGYYLCRNYPSAAGLYKCLLEINSDEPTYLSDFGCVKYKVGLYDDAVELFEKAAGMQPQKKRHQKLHQLALKRSGT